MDGSLAQRLTTDHRPRHRRDQADREILGHHTLAKSGKHDDLATGCVVFHTAVRFHDGVQVEHSADLGVMRPLSTSFAIVRATEPVQCRTAI